MSNDPFSAPSTATGITWADHLGQLLLINVIEERKEIQTAYGETSAIEANVTVLDGPNVGQKFDDILIFPRVLQSQLRPRIGGMVLGRLNQGEKKAGQSAPWKLSDPTDDDRKVGVAHINKNTAPPF